MDAAGNAIAVWSLWNGTTTKSSIWSSRYVRGIGWGVPGRIDASSTNSAWGPNLAVNPAGDAIAIWVQWNGTASGISASRYSNGAWGIPVQLVASGLASNDPRLAMDAAGNATVVWSQGGGPASSIRSTRFAPGVGWSAVEVIESFSDWGSQVWLGEVAMDRFGNAIVVWGRSFGPRLSVAASRYVPRSGWGVPAELEVVDGGNGPKPRVGLDSQGNAIVVWSTNLLKFDEPGPSRVWANRYEVGVGWRGERALDLGAGGAWDPQVGMDARGNAIVVWQQRHGPRFNIWSNSYAASTGWGNATLVGRGSGGDLTPQVATDGNGNAIAVWSQGDGTNASIWASISTVGVGWSSATQIGSSPGAAFAPQVGVDPRGGAISVWEQWDGVRYAIRSSHYDGGAGWSPSTAIDAGSGNAFVPHVAVDPTGNAVAVWQQWDGRNLHVWANRYVIGLGWSNATSVEKLVGLSSEPRLGIDGHGNAIAVWENSINWGVDPIAIWANRYAVGAGWGSPEVLGTYSWGGASDPQVALDADGDAIVVWSDQSGILANRFEPGVGWKGPKQVGANRTSHSPQIAMDAQGNAAVVWQESTYDYERVWATRYLVGGAWGDWEAPAQLTLRNVNYAESPHVAVDPSGNAVAVWRQLDGGNLSVWVNRYVVDRGWRGSGLISRNGGLVSTAQVATDATGSAIVVWTQWNATGPSVWSNRYVRSNVPPDLSLTMPSATLTNNPVVTLSGTTLPGAFVTVDGVFEPVDEHGVFSHTVTLPDGPHTFVVVASDSDGNTNTQTVSVIVDTEAPTLILAAPTTGATSTASFVDVAGRTEPGSQVVVNGLPVAVASNGSFSIRIGLVEGMNTIVATARDAAGNVATASATVTYVNPLVNDIAFLRGVAIASSSGVVVLAVLLLVLYLMRWDRRRGDENPQNGLQLEGQDGASSEVLDAQRWTSGTVLAHAQATDRRWPAKATSGPVRLTAKERILLHLQHFARYADASEVPPELTQGRIVEAAGIDRRHFAQYVHPLVRDGLVRERTAHVRGVVQRRRVYVLTEEGRIRALGVRDRIRSAVVRVRDASGVREVTVAEALLEARGTMSVLDILRESIETGVVDLTR